MSEPLSRPRTCPVCRGKFYTLDSFATYVSTGNISRVCKSCFETTHNPFKTAQARTRRYGGADPRSFRHPLEDVMAQWVRR